MFEEEAYEMLMTAWKGIVFPGYKYLLQAINVFSQIVFIDAIWGLEKCKTLKLDFNKVDSNQAESLI